MLTWEDDLEVHALRKRGWSISAIARHTGHDRKTVRKYLAGEATPGVRARPSLDPFDPFVDYVTARLAEDPHLWARTLFDELGPLGFGLSYQSLTPQPPGAESAAGVPGLPNGRRAPQRGDRASTG
jgi:transposase